MGSSATTSTYTSQVNETTTYTDSFNTANYDVTSVGDVGNVSIMPSQMSMPVVLAALGTVAAIVIAVLFFKR